MHRGGVGSSTMDPAGPGPTALDATGGEGEDQIGPARDWGGPRGLAMSDHRATAVGTLPRDEQATSRNTETAVPGKLEVLWSHRPAGLAAAVAIAAVAGLLAAWLTPRGPLTTAQALISIGAALGVGVAAATTMGTRWSMLVTPVVFMAVFEVGRIGAQGPTVDAISLSTLGLYALVVGRVAHGLLVLTPMVLGTGFGLLFARRLGNDRGPTPRVPAWIVTGLLTLVVLLLAVVVARPASTAPILGTDGQVLPGSIAELATVEIGGVDQVMMIRGRSINGPVLLHLAGGPGGTDIGAMRADTGLEQDFVVVTWDQRGTGKSYATSLDPVADLTLEQAIEDTLEVTRYLRERFGQDRIYLTANSWGSIPSVFAVQRQPELFRAYIGSGQMVDNRATDQMFYEDVLAWAEETGDDGLTQRIRDAGPPPYDDLLDYEYTTMYEHSWNTYPGMEHLSEMPFNSFVPENTVMDRINAARALFDVNWFVYPQLQDYDFRRDAPRLEVPVYIVHGRYEARGRDVPLREWFDVLEAPSKQLVVFEHSGHRPTFEEPDRFTALMADVLGETGGAR